MGHAEHGLHAIEAGTPDYEANDAQTNLTDALSNMMHAAHADDGLDWHAALRSAERHFAYELGEEELPPLALAVKLAAKLNDGDDPHKALDALDIDADDVTTEHECIGLTDTDNDVIDLCNGALVRRYAGAWHAEQYR